MDGTAAKALVAEFDAAPYDFAEARAIVEGLGLAEPVAIALVRRGHRSVEQAKAFLEADERHSYKRFEGIDDACALIAAAISAGERITVHGDYDVDGMAATALLVGALRELGAGCDWVIPDRLADGYGLGRTTIAEIAERGSSLLISVDCGIASADEVAFAQELGLDVVVTDHHQRGDRLPDCPIVHPEVNGYPFPGLCGTAVAHKLAEALADALGASSRAERDLDIVALATVADMVPLLGENRSIVRRGLAQMRRAPRVGLAELMAVSSVEAERVDEGDIGFRLAPRLNAAGRLYRADAGVELLLSADRSRAAEIARELDNANHERRAIEREVLHAAEAAVRELPGELREAPALVVAGEGWHPGVVGIVASRIAERHCKPAILIALEPDGSGRGSGRSRGDFDLLAGLRACSEHLGRFGGHKAAAGVEIEAGKLDAFQRAFAAHAAATIPAEGLSASDRVDAVVGADALGLNVAEQLARLGPFGIGNPGIRLLVPWARLANIRAMGEGGAHARFSLTTGGAAAQGVAFRIGERLAKAGLDPHDLTVSLELNHWNGSVEPRAVLGRAHPLGPAPEQEPGRPGCECGGPESAASFTRRFEASLEAAGIAPAEGAAESTASREKIDAHGAAIVARISELISSGAPVLAVCADAGRRASLATLAASPGRFRGTGALVCRRCPPGALARAATEIETGGGPGLLLSDWESLLREPAVATRFTHIVAVDPAADPYEAAAAAGRGYLHQVWGPPELEFSRRILAQDWQPRAALAEIFRAVRSSALSGEDLDLALRGAGRIPRSAEIAARCVLILGELGLAELSGRRSARTLGVVSSERTELDRSGAWRRFEAVHEERLEFLQNQKQD